MIPHTSQKQRKTTLVEQIASYTIWLMLCLFVIPLSALNTTLQYQVVILLVAVFVLADLLFQRTKQIVGKEVFQYFMVLVAYFAIILLVLSTGGVGSDYFFLLYVLVLIASFSISLVGELIVAMAMLLSIGLQMATGGGSTDDADIVALVIKLLSLVSLSPLVLYLVTRYNEVQQQSDDFAQTKQLLKLHEASGQILINVISAGVLIADRDFRITFLSVNGERQFQLQNNDVMGKLLFEILQFSRPGYEEGDHLALEMQHALQHNHEKISMQCTVTNNINQQSYDLLINAQPLLDSRGEMISAMFIFEDREKRESLRQMYNRAELMTGNSG